jgi:hypothetical protein
MKTLLTIAISLVTLTGFAQTKITSAEISKHVGDSVTICETLTGGRFLEQSSITLLNFGGAYPNQLFTAVIRGKVRDQFKVAPESDLKGKKVCVTGKITMYQDRPQIVIYDAKQIRITTGQ